MKLTFIGRRIEGTELVHAFIDHAQEAGAPYVYWPNTDCAKFKGAQIGRTFQIGDEIPDLWKTSRKRVDFQAEKWQVEDQAAAARYATWQLTPSPELDETVAKLRSHRARLMPADRYAFDGWLLNALNSPH